MAIFVIGRYRAGSGTRDTVFDWRAGAFALAIALQELFRTVSSI